MDKQRKEYVSVKLEKTLVATLHELKRPSQTLTGVIQELVDCRGKEIDGTDANTGKGKTC